MSVFSRYVRDDLLSSGKGLKSSRSIEAIRSGISLGTIPVSRRFTTTEGDRLDVLAASFYGDARYWWILAAASGIGWSVQVPPGIFVLVPTLKDVEKIIG